MNTLGVFALLVLSFSQTTEAGAQSREITTTGGSHTDSPIASSRPIVTSATRGSSPGRSLLSVTLEDLQ